VPELVYMTTSLSGGIAGLTTMSLALYIDHVESVPILCNGILAGLVGVTASCNAIETWAAIVIGVISGVL